MNRVRLNKAKLVVATDILSRGYDSEYVDMVFNLDLATRLSGFKHREGRTGRNFRTGISVVFEEDL